jgi:hypothetical protein
MSNGQHVAALTLLAEALILSREGFTGQGGGPTQIAEAIDFLVQTRIEQAVEAIDRYFDSQLQNAALGRDALILPPTDLAVELAKAWGR